MKVEQAFREIRPALVRRVEALGARVVLETSATGDVGGEHLVSPLRVVLLALADHVPRGGTMTVRATDRAGGDVEVEVTGLRLPDDFPKGSRFEDLWRAAFEFLAQFHRARVASGEDRVLLLIPDTDRADRLRRAEA